MKKAIIGHGGFGREVYQHILNNQPNEEVCFFVDDAYANGDVLPLSKFNPKIYQAVVAIGDPELRRQMVNKLPKETTFFSVIHSSVVILDKNIEIGEGSVICAGCILTTNIKIGKHAQLNLQTTVGHDCVIGDYFTTAPGVKISGNCSFGNLVYVGTNASVKEKISICDYVTIGLNSGVVKNITESGIYIGTPCKALNK